MNVGPGLPSRQLPAPPPPLVPAYSLIVAGPAAAGKSSLLRLLLHTAPLSPHATPAQHDARARFLRAPPDAFAECELDVLWAGERVLLRLIDAPRLDFAQDALLERGLHDILHFVEARYIDGARDEATVGESHVHLCLYVLDPATIVPRPYAPPAPAAAPAPTTALPPAEIAAIRRLSSRVNVLPVLGRSDAVPLARLAELKRAVRRDLADAGLGFGIFDGDATAPCALADDVALPLLPYALFSPETFPPAPPAPPLAEHHDDDDARIAALHGRFVRRFRWGVLDALDPRHADFIALRRAIMLHHKVLKKYTKDYLYEKFKVDSLLAAQNHHKGRVHPASVHALLNHRDERDPEHDYARPVSAGAPSRLSPLHHHPARLPPVAYDREDDDRERLLRERERERDRERERERDREQREREEAQRDAAPPEENAPNRKRKITMACNFCRSRKLKCDGVRPACAQCVKRANACDYQPHAPGHGQGWKYKRCAAAAPPPAPRQPHEDIDELEDEASSAASDAGAYAGSGAARKRVSVDMLIAATLDHAPAAPAPALPATTPPAATPTPWYDAASTGMSVLDVGSEGDKKKRLNRQSANYGSKAVACVHCRARKTRCDAARPACGNCARRTLVCSYVHTQPSQPRSKGKKAAAATAAAAQQQAKSESESWSPAPLDGALEESAERERPRSPAAPPIATLGVHGGAGQGGGGTPERRSSTPAKRTRTASPEQRDAAAAAAAWVGAGAGVEVRV